MTHEELLDFSKNPLPIRVTNQSGNWSRLTLKISFAMTSKMHCLARRTLERINQKKLNLRIIGIYFFMSIKKINRFNFSKAILHWFDVHGRKDLPWQLNPSPYRVWISEIMLQQTQVNTAIPYYLRFMDSFPDIHSLSSASTDRVMHHLDWLLCASKKLAQGKQNCTTRIQRHDSLGF